MVGTPDEWANRFSKKLELEGVSPNTARTCLASVRLFLLWYPTFTRKNLESYRTRLIAERKPSTVNTRIYGMNCFLRHFGREMPLIGTFSLPYVSLQRKPFLDRIISQAQYERLRAYLSRQPNRIWYFIVRFLCATGMRISELLQIKVEHIKMGYMDLYSKGGKLRRVYFPDSLCEEAFVWLDARDIKTGFVFTGCSGKVLSARWINSRLKQFAGECHVPAEVVYPHSFRHRFAKNFLQRCSDIALLADLLGHDHIETTRIYLTRSSEELHELIDRIVVW